MKANINQEVWSKFGILSKIFLVIGMFCMHMSMKLAGMDQEK